MTLCHRQRSDTERRRITGVFICQSHVDLIYLGYNGGMDDKSTTTVRILAPTPEEASLLRILTPEEKLQILLKAAREKAAKTGK